ncbi:MAG: DUF2946 domain-containing protein [Pseudomonadota bacterium]
MKQTRHHRELTAWVLYFSILFSAFACSISHGRMAGLQLSGIGGAYCSSQGNLGSGLDAGFAGPSGGGLTSLLGCPLCGALGLGLALLFCLGWLRLAARCPRPSFERRRNSPPRYTWPSANPRASPFLA